MTTIRYSYAYLFDPKLQPDPEMFDAQFRWACDLHMVALADMIRESKREGRSDDASAPIEWYGGKTTIRVGRNEMSWGLDQYDELHVAADFRVEGLPSPDSRRGFGVPCILRRRWNRDALQESFDAARVQGCPIAVPEPDGTTIPTCSYNVLYRERDPRFRTAAEVTEQQPEARPALPVVEA